MEDHRWPKRILKAVPCISGIKTKWFRRVQFLRNKYKCKTEDLADDDISNDVRCGRTKVRKAGN